MKHIFTISLCFLALSLSAQTCITTPGDLIWTCDQEDNEFIYLNYDGVTIADCLDPSIIYELTMPIDVAIEELGCVSETHPGVLRRITRTFVYETGNPLDVSCPSYGAGFICATQVIEVRDETNPTFSIVPPNVEIECDDWNLEEYLLSNDFGLLFYDNCETPTNQTSFAFVEESECSAEQTFIWTFTLTDLCGNSAQDTHVVNVVDTNEPVIVFDPEIPEVFNCVDDVVWPEISASDCSSVAVGWDGEPNIIVHDCPNNFTLTREAFATDDCGNEVTMYYTIAVIDEQPPQFIDLLTDETIQCDNSAAIDLALSAVPTFDDGCNEGSLNIDIVLINGVCPQNYTVEKTFVAEDACGNQSEPHTITITVEDTEAPTITLPSGGFVIECGQPFVLDDPVVEDNCDFGIISLETDTVETGDLSDGDLMSTITYISTDACGNSSQSEVVVNIVDTQPPYFTSFPPDLVVACGDDYPDDTVSYEDACDPDAFLVDYELQIDIQPCANNTVVSSIYTISDGAGNETTQTQSTTFLDEVAPILIAPLDPLFYQFVNEVPDCMEIFEGLEFDDCSGEVVLTDCSDVVVAGICAEQDCTIERTYYFADACGNQGSANQTITVDESILGVTDLEANRGKRLIMFLDVLGREVNYTTNQILFHVYDDGSVEKKFVVE